MKTATLRVPMSPGAKNCQTKTVRAPQKSLEPAGNLPRQRSDSQLALSARHVTKGVRNRALFHINSVVSQVWLMQLRKRIQASYAQPGAGSHRPLQSGYAWRSFSTFFEPLDPIELVRLFENLLRFASYDGYPPSRAFFLAYAPLAFEHDASGEYIGPGVWSPPLGSQKAAHRVRRTLQRWCDWLEALTHFEVHLQRRSPEACNQLDKTIILLWPLVKRHRWSAVDLLGFLRAHGSSGEVFQSAEEFASYCHRVLALRFDRVEKGSGDGQLPGQEIAGRLIKFLPAIC